MKIPDDRPFARTARLIQNLGIDPMIVTADRPERAGYTRFVTDDENKRVFNRVTQTLITVKERWPEGTTEQQITLILATYDEEAALQWLTKSR